MLKYQFGLLFYSYMRNFIFIGNTFGKRLYKDSEFYHVSLVHELMVWPTDTFFSSFNCEKWKVTYKIISVSNMLIGGCGICWKLPSPQISMSPKNINKIAFSIRKSPTCPANSECRKKTGWLILYLEGQ